MPRFATISPTHKPGAKPAAWKRFRDGGYIALGWHHVDYSAYPLAEIKADLKKRKYDNEKDAILAHTFFRALEIGDIVAVNNSGHDLFGVGVITSDYQFKERKHPTGHTADNEHYSHYREVRWIDVTKRSVKDLVLKHETQWKPRGTMSMLDHVPPYITRLLDSLDYNFGSTSIDGSIDQELIGYEGLQREEMRLHKWVERDKRFIAALRKKLAHIKRCMACELDPEKNHNMERDRFLEAHHIVPLYQRRSDVISITKECDIALLCPNCHTLMHRYMSDQGGEALSVAELKTKLDNPRKQ